MRSELKWTPDEYLTKRVDSQIQWYDNRCAQSQKWYKWLRILQIILAVSIPFLVAYISESRPVIQFSVALAGVLIAIIGGLLSLNKYLENWIEYRSTCESLRHHKYKFLTKVGLYASDDAFTLFVENIERLISQEHTRWVATSINNSRGHKNG